jgi:hypothetical protein
VDFIYSPLMHNEFSASVLVIAYEQKKKVKLFLEQAMVDHIVLYCIYSVFQISAKMETELVINRVLRRRGSHIF